MRVHLLFVLLLFTQMISAQSYNDSASTFYPVETGNTWQYERKELVDYMLWKTISYQTVKIIGDTLLDNGKVYKIFEENSDITEEKKINVQKNR